MTDSCDSYSKKAPSNLQAIVLVSLIPNPQSDKIIFSGKVCNHPVCKTKCFIVFIVPKLNNLYSIPYLSWGWDPSAKWAVLGKAEF